MIKNYTNNAGKQLTLTVDIDNDPINPRKEFDNLSTMVCLHRRYKLGDINNFDDVESAEASVPKGSVIVPIYMYEHGDICIKSTPFACSWDSGKLGFAYITPEVGQREFGRYWKKKAEKCIQGEITDYNSYLTGQVFCWVLDEVGGEALDACYGYFDEESCEADALASVPDDYREIASEDYHFEVKQEVAN